MSKRAEYFQLAERCRKMADRSNSEEGKERWLTLACKWLALGEEAGATTEFENMLRDQGTGQPGSDSTH